MLDKIQMEVELYRLTDITYEIVYKYYKVIKNRIDRLGKLLVKYKHIDLYDVYDRIVALFSLYSNQSNSTPQSY